VSAALARVAGKAASANIMMSESVYFRYKADLEPDFVFIEELPREILVLQEFWLGWQRVARVACQSHALQDPGTELCEE